MKKIGVDIGGTKVKVGLFSDRMLLAVKKLYISDITDLPDSILCCISELCRENNTSPEEIVSCGVGIPGTVDTNGKSILKAPNLPVLHTDIAEKLEALLGVPVTLAQDSRAAAWGEFLCGGGVGARTVVCVTLGTGIGCGIVKNGKIYDGALGCAGEIGHIPVKPNGRKCGCGKCGCVEKYSAGGGLDITARELLGEGATARDLFDAVRNGNEDAGRAVSEAVLLLGNALVAVVNLLSPDCLLISGGLSAQEELYLRPLIEYIKSHCYTAGAIPNIKKAELGEDAPLFGAALLPGEEKRKPLLSASIMCADALNFGEALAEIEEAGIQYIHCDIMDNHFVPNLMLPPELLNKLRRGCGLPFDFHLMTEAPECIIEKLDIRPNDIVSVHAESTPHLQKVISKIREKGARAAVALNPATPLSMLDELLPELDMVLIMCVNPGFAGQKIAPGSFEKIARMKKRLCERGLGHILIEVDGNCSFENVPKMARAGADIFVVGTSSVFCGGMSIREGIEKLLALMRNPKDEMI